MSKGLSKKQASTPVCCNPLSTKKALWEKGVGLIHDIPTVKELFDRIMAKPQKQCHS
ncbi:MAG: hypothetical protein QNK28_05085 [Desulfobacterales bacterium]|nr:hypothetical protein [Desulfobacterales bacterium]